MFNNLLFDTKTGRKFCFQYQKQVTSVSNVGIIIIARVSNKLIIIV